MEKLEIICLESAAYYKTIETLLERFKLTQKQEQDKWISGSEAMRMLRIKSRATLQKMRDEGRIRYSQPEKKILLYDTESILAYIEDFVYEPFDMPKQKR